MNRQTAVTGTVRQTEIPALLDKRVTDIKGKEGNVHPRTGHDGPEGEQRYSSTLSLTSALDGGGVPSGAVG